MVDQAPIRLDSKTYHAALQRRCSASLPPLSLRQSQNQSSGVTMIDRELIRLDDYDLPVETFRSFAAYSGTLLLVAEHPTFLVRLAQI